MRKSLYLPALLMLLLMNGCKDHASLGGQVVDGKSRPLGGVKVIATQVQPVKGFETNAALTDSNGFFTIGKLYPSSDYSLSFVLPVGDANAAYTMRTGPPKTAKAQVPIRVRFVLLKNGVILDTRTGLQWAPDAGVTLSWQRSQEYAAALRLGGYDDWRMATRKELFDLLDISKLDTFGVNNGSPLSAAEAQRSFIKLNPFYNLGECTVWTSEVSNAPVILPPELYDNVRTQLADRVNIWLFNFCTGQYLIKSESKLGHEDGAIRSIRTLAVRSTESRAAASDAGPDETAPDK